MSTQAGRDKFVGMQISPISFIDEGVDNVLDTLTNRVGVNVLMLGTVSWLGLKSGRSISYAIDGWPDHGIKEPFSMKGGAYFNPHSEYYRGTRIKEFRSPDEELQGLDILETVIPEAKSRGMKVFVELMEPFFKYAGHGSSNNVSIPNIPQMLEVDALGRIGSEPSTDNRDYRTWILSMVEDQVRSYDIDGVMWCNERRSPLDQVLTGKVPGDFSADARNEAEGRGIDVEAARQALLAIFRKVQELRNGTSVSDGALIEFLRVVLRHPEALIWERFWVERNKDLDRELYGLVKWCKPDLSYGLNVWNRNHFNPLRKAQWPWAEQAEYADWVKPITYQHQAGLVYTNEMQELHKSVLRDYAPPELTPIMYRALGLDEAPWDDLVGAGMDPDTYVYGQCRDALQGVDGQAKVYMGIGVDAPRSREDQARCDPDIVYKSVHATYGAGGHGVVFSPNYASMNLTNLDGAARALQELGLK